MRLIFLNRYFHPDHSATSQMLSDLAFFLAGAGHQVCVITSRQRYDDPAVVLPAYERINGVDVHRVRTSHFGRASLPGRALDYASFYCAAAWRLWRVARNHDVIVAKTDPPLISVVVGWVAHWRGARLVNWVQDVFPEVAEALGMRVLSGPQAGLLRRLRNRAFRSAAANVVLGESMAAVLARAGVPDTHIHVLPNWADQAAIYPVAAADNPLRRDWGLEGRCIVCYSGNMGRAHEFDTILGAAQLLADQSATIGFLFIGGGAQRGRVEQQVRSRALGNVEFRPYQDAADLRFSLGAGDIHLVSQRPEVEGYVFPSKLYGILAAGRPLVFIGDPEGEISRLVAQEGVGVSVRQGDAAGLAAQLLHLAGADTLRDTMGQRARALLCARYDKSIALKAWEALLVKVARPALPGSGLVPAPQSPPAP